MTKWTLSNPWYLNGGYPDRFRRSLQNKVSRSQWNNTWKLIREGSEKSCSFLACLFSSLRKYLINDFKLRTRSFVPSFVPSLTRWLVWWKLSKLAGWTNGLASLFECFQQSERVGGSTRWQSWPRRSRKSASESSKMESWRYIDCWMNGLIYDVNDNYANN